MTIGKTLLLSYACLLVFLLLLFLTVLYFIQEKLIFVPDTLPKEFQFQIRTPFTESTVDVATSDGTLRLHSLLVRPPQARALIVYFHGNAGNLSSWGDVAERLALQTNSAVWIFDYPGYGRSTGSITSEEQIHLFSKQVYLAALRDPQVADLPVVLYGRSIGTGFASHLAAELATEPAAGSGVEPPSASRLVGLILETPYFSFTRLAEKIVRFLPGSLLRVLLKYRFPQDEWVAKVRVPMLLLHGDRDEVISFANSVELKKVAGPQARLVIIPGLGHNNLADSPLYWRSVEEFLGENLPSGKRPGR